MSNVPIRWLFDKMHASAENTDTSKKRHGISFRNFSLRSFLIAFTLLAICFAVWANRARRQRTAVADLRELGVTVYYDFDVTRGLPTPTSIDDLGGEYELAPGPDGYLGTPTVSDVPAWLVNSLGIDYFHTTPVVFLDIPRPMDALPFLKRLRNLKEVHFPWRLEPNDQSDLDQLRNELPGVTVISYNAFIG